jgi:hypothetical protein
VSAGGEGWFWRVTTAITTATAITSMTMNATNNFVRPDQPPRRRSGKGLPPRLRE